MIELRPHVGQCRGQIVDMGFDSIWENGRRIGYVGRKKDSPIQFIEPVAESVVAEVRTVVDARDFADLPDNFAAAIPVREVWLAPPPADPADLEDDD